MNDFLLFAFRTKKHFLYEDNNYVHFVLNGINGQTSFLTKKISINAIASLDKDCFYSYHKAKEDLKKFSENNDRWEFYISKKDEAIECIKNIILMKDIID